MKENDNNRQIFEFLFPDLEQVTEAFNKLILASGMEDEEIKEIDDDKLIDEVIKRVSTKEITGSLSAISKFASVVVPIGLRINPKDMTIKEGLGYLPKIVEVNKDFFPVLLEAVNQTAEEIVKIMKNLTKSPGKDSTQ